MTTADTCLAQALSNLSLDGRNPERSTRNGIRIPLGPQLLTFPSAFNRITTRPISEKAVAAELIWMLSGQCSTTTYLQQHGVKIWDQWGSLIEDGDHGPTRHLGPIYGVQWRHRTDQVNRALSLLVRDPGSSQAVIDAWSPQDLPEMALPPCHFAHQLILQPGGSGLYRFELHVFQRSCDVPIGLPYNMAFYGLLAQAYTALLRVRGLRTGVSVTTFHISEAHVYKTHLDDPDARAWLALAKNPPKKVPRPLWLLQQSDVSDLEAILKHETPDPSVLMRSMDPIDPDTTVRLKAVP